MNDMRIFFLDETPQHLPTLANWFFTEWAYLYPDRSLKEVEEKLEAYKSQRKIPLSLLLCRSQEVIATASLCLHDMETHMHLTPWLESVYVPQEARKRGYGSIVVKAAMMQARTLGINTLYLYTPDQEEWYKKVGWKLVERPIYRGSAVSIMKCELGRI